MFHYHSEIAHWPLGGDCKFYLKWISSSVKIVWSADESITLLRTKGWTKQIEEQSQSTYGCWFCWFRVDFESVRRLKKKMAAKLVWIQHPVLLGQMMDEQSSRSEQRFLRRSLLILAREFFFQSNTHDRQGCPLNSTRHILQINVFSYF